MRLLAIDTLLEALAKKRPIFHSEADFQHSLAWQIHEAFPSAQIRLKTPLSTARRERLDIRINNDTRTFALELKYKKRRFEGEFFGEQFLLRKDGAHDIARYDFIKDIARLERWVAEDSTRIGCAIFLTDDDLYWRQSRREGYSAAFFVHEGRRLEAGRTLKWHDDASEGTKRGRIESLTLQKERVLVWKDYSPRDTDAAFSLLSVGSQLLATGNIPPH